MADVPDSITVSDSGFTLPTSEILTGRGFVTGKSGSGKSVLEGTIVYTEEGRKPIEEVNRGEKVLSLNKHDYQQEFREVLATIEHESDELLRIRLEDGTELVGTKDHSFLTVDDLEIVPIRGDQLEVGTWFPLARELPTSEAVTSVDLGEYVEETRDLDINDDTIRSGQKTDDRYLELDFVYGKVLGLYLADGSFDSSLTVQISNVDESVKAFLGAHGFKVYARSCNRAFKPFGRFVEAEFGRGSGGKVVPSWVFDAPSEFQAGVLSGYIDGDGTVADTVTAMSKSPDLIAGIKELLRHFGVSSTARDKFTVYKAEERRYRRLRVDAFSLGRLRDVVELSVTKKADALDRAVEALEEGDRYNAKDMNPGFGPVLTHATREQGWTSRGSEHRTQGKSAHHLTRKQKASRTTFNRFVKDLVMEGRAKKFGRSDIQWKRVVEIEELEETRTVYDLDVQLNDNFIADGVFVHNSNSTSVVAEELLEHGLPLLIVDTDGEYFGLKDRYEVLHVGADADCDATVGVEHAEKIAELALVQNVPVVLDLSGFLDENESRELFRRAVERLFALGKRIRKPFPVFVEEIHEFLPQSGTVDELSDALIAVAKRGRKRGIGICGMSQRPAAVDKDFITQCDWVVWHRLTWDNDKRVASQMLGADAAGDIDELATGEALVMTDWDTRVERVRFRRKHTYDAGAAPDLADIGADTYQPVRTELLDELSGKEADLNEVDFEELAAGRGVPDPPDGSSVDSLETAADAVIEATARRRAARSVAEEAGTEDDGGSATSRVGDGGRSVVTIASRPAGESTQPPGGGDDVTFDPIWELGHLVVFVVSRLGRGLHGLLGAVLDAVAGLWWGLRALGRDVERAFVAPVARVLEQVAARQLPDRVLVAAVVVLLAAAGMLLLVP